MVVLISLAVGGAVLALLRIGDRHRLNRAGTVFLLVFTAVGAFSVLPGLFLYALAGDLPRTGRWDLIVYVWTVNAPIEELAKYACFAVTAGLLRTIRQPQDGILQGAATGLGFGLVENFLYGLDGGWELLLLRSLLSLPGHMVYGAVWGGYHGFEAYQGGGRVRRWWVPALALVPAVFSHALFNTLVFVQAPFEWALVGDGLMIAFGLFLFSRLGAFNPGRRPLREWRQAIPEVEHALRLQPDSDVLRQRLAAYQLAAGRPEDALATLEPLESGPWTTFYRDAARVRLSPSGKTPASAVLNPQLFQRLSGG